jgi:Putative sensor
VLALGALVWVAFVVVSCVVGPGFLLIPSALRATRAVADRERSRLTRWGPEVVGAMPFPDDWRTALRDSAVRRELAGLMLQATIGFAAGLLGLALSLYAVQSLTFPLCSGSFGIPPGRDWRSGTSTVLRMPSWSV